jgi:hypothetical protein
MEKKNITVCLRSVAASLLKRIGISGLVGAGIGLVYSPLSFGLICMAYAFEDSLGNALVNILGLPALPFFFFASYMQLPAVPFFVISIVFFTVVGAGIGAGVHWTRNLVKKTRASRG